MQYTIQELKLGGILDQAVAVLKNRFTTLMTITCFLYVPWYLIYEFSLYLLIPDMAGGEPTPESVAAFREIFPTLAVLYAIFMVLLVVVVPLTNAAVISAVANEYLGRPVTAWGSMKYAMGVLLPLIAASFITWVLILLGFMLCLIPGILLLFRYWFTSHAVVIEKSGPLTALKRSAALMGGIRKGNADTALVLGVLLFVIGLFIGGVTRFIPVRVIAIPVAVLTQAALMVFGAAASVVFYFSCRCKLEHFDLAILADSVAKEPGTSEAAEGAAE